MAAEDLEGAAPQGHADRPRVDHLPGLHPRGALPKLSESGLKVGEDFFLCFSPERVDPGNEKWHTKNTPKVVGGTTPRCLEAIQAMYGEVLEHAGAGLSTDAAEMVKLLENTFRAVNIGLVNEVAIMCHKLGLNTWEVIDAAATKPFGFMRFYPGPGLGGHCIPVDPLYLSWKLKTLKYEARFIELADDINTAHAAPGRREDAGRAQRAEEGGQRLARCWCSASPTRRTSTTCASRRRSTSSSSCRRKGAEVSYHDPYARVGAHRRAHAQVGRRSRTSSSTTAW